MKYVISIFIPFFVIFLFLSNKQAFIEFSHSILGKLFAVLLIIFYTWIDVMIGVAICLIVILYYQTDTIEEMLNYIEYNPNNYNSSFTVPSPAVLEFQKENCDGNVLKYKNMEVKSTLAEHVFPNIHFGNGEPCNPCSPSCTFSIIESKLKTEEEMIPESTVL